MPGISGYGTALLGAANGEFSVTAVLLSNLAGVAVWEAALQAMQGTVVSIVDDHGTTHTYCELERVSNARITPAYQPGTGVTKRGEIVLQGKKVG
jgi:hypothetical protein